VLACALDLILAGVTRVSVLFVITDGHGNPIGLQLPGRPRGEDGI
jgi:hypothetical protein